MLTQKGIILLVVIILVAGCSGKKFVFSKMKRRACIAKSSDLARNDANLTLCRISISIRLNAKLSLKETCQSMKTWESSRGRRMSG
jgi:hypothetical protein